MVADNIAAFISVLLPASVIGAVFVLFFSFYRRRDPRIYDAKRSLFGYVLG